MKKIYIVEDNESIRELVVYALESEKYFVQGFEDSSLFWEAIKENIPDLIILDIMLPNESGMQILKKLREKEIFKDLPIIMLTAKGTEYERLKGFSEGADDYIVKPFSILELVARVKVFLKRSKKIEVIDNDNEILILDDLVVNMKKRNVKINDEKIDLTYKEFELLSLLLQNKGIVFSRDKLLNKIWGYDYEGETRTVDMHIKTLRKKINDKEKYIKTVRGVGYKIGD